MSVGLCVCRAAPPVRPQFAIRLSPLTVRVLVGTMASDEVYMAKLAEQAERYDEVRETTFCTNDILHRCSPSPLI